jgi:hypothetical protein
MSVTVASGKAWLGEDDCDLADFRAQVSELLA